MMKLYAPVYYPQFRCTADRCSHSCCVGWEIDIDEQTEALYRSLPGDFGQELRAGMLIGEEGASFSLRPTGKCPMLDERGLCRIISTLGEDYLCDICREHPRFYNAVGAHMECGVGASCEEAARLILTTEDYRTLLPIGDLPGEGATREFDADAWRERVYDLLADRTRPLAERLVTVEQAFAIFCTMCQEEHASLFSSMEYLDEAHRDLLIGLASVAWPEGEGALACERFFAYLVYRHASPAQDEGEFRAALGLALVLCRLFCSLCAQGYAPVSAAVLLSEEIEYSEENTERLKNTVLPPV